MSTGILQILVVTLNEVLWLSIFDHQELEKHQKALAGLKITCFIPHFKLVDPALLRYLQTSCEMAMCAGMWAAMGPCVGTQTWKYKYVKTTDQKQ